MLKRDVKKCREEFLWPILEIFRAPGPVRLNQMVDDFGTRLLSGPVYF